MVTREGCYYGTPFTGHQGVTHGYPLSLTMFNMMVGSVIFHWVILVMGEEAGPDGFGRAVQGLATLFYANNGLLISPRKSRLQAALYVLTGLFDRVSLHTNVKKQLGWCVGPAILSAGTRR